MLFSEMPKYGELTKVVQDIFQHFSTCFFMDLRPNNIYDPISIDLSFFRSSFTVQKPYRESCLLEEILTKQVSNKLQQCALNEVQYANN